MSVRISIQNKVKELIEAEECQRVKYDPKGNAYLLDEKIRPLKVYVNESSSDFAQDSRNGRELSLFKAGWSFKISVNFKNEVTTEAMENTFKGIPKIVVDGHRYFVILQSVSATHPPQSDALNGTSVAITLNIKDRL